MRYGVLFSIHITGDIPCCVSFLMHSFLCPVGLLDFISSLSWSPEPDGQSGSGDLYFDLGACHLIKKLFGHEKKIWFIHSSYKVLFDAPNP